jgi:hypothetical protein
MATTGDSCLDRDEMSTLYRGPSIDVSYQVSVHLTKRFQRRFLESPLLGLLISSRSISKHGRHRQFLLLIGWFLRKSSLLKER